jgi:hypothetical protein
VGDGNDAIEIKVYNDPMIVINLSTWESIDALYQYTYFSDHVEVFRRRRDWFEKIDKPTLTMWWVPAGHYPTAEESRDKYEYFLEHGVTPLAFTFKQPYTVEEMLAYLEQNPA